MLMALASNDVDSVMPRCLANTLRDAAFSYHMIDGP